MTPSTSSDSDPLGEKSSASPSSNPSSTIFNEQFIKTIKEYQNRFVNKVQYHYSNISNYCNTHVFTPTNLEKVDKFNRRFVQGIGISIGVFLIGNYIYCTSGTIIQYRIKKRLLNKKTIKDLVTLPSAKAYIPLDRTKPLIPQTIPTLVMGPLGCGKTSLLRKVAKTLYLQNHVPVGYLDFSSHQHHYTTNDFTTKDKQTEIWLWLKICTQNIYKQIDFPNELPILKQFLYNITDAWDNTYYRIAYQTKLLTANDIYQLQLNKEEERILHRFHEAMYYYFQVLESIHNKRKNDYAIDDHNDTIPVLIIDVHDFCTGDPNILHQTSYYKVWKIMVQYIKHYGIDGQHIRTIIGGHNIQHDLSLHDKTIIGNQPLNYYSVPLPTIDNIYMRLRHNEYSEEQCNKIINRHGVCLRWLQKYLDDSPDKKTYAKYLDNIDSKETQASMAQGTITRLFSEITNKQDYQILFHIFNTLYEGKETIKWDTIPESIQKLSIYIVLYKTEQGDIQFQDRQVHNGWKYAKPIIERQIHQQTVLS